MKFNLIKPDNLLSILNQINNNIEFTILKSQKTTFFTYNDKQKRYKNLDGYLQQTNRLKTTICPIYMNPPTALSNKYTTLSFKKSMYHC